MKLTWKDVDFEKSQIVVRESKSSGWSASCSTFRFL
jgi:hypothetical protein